MSTGHQVIITFDIDEDRVTENAEKEAGRQIAKQIIDEVFGKSYDRGAAMRRYVKDVIEEMIGPMKERIIKEAVAEVVGNLHRTKAVKELLSERTNAEE